MLNIFQFDNMNNALHIFFNTVNDGKIYHSNLLTSLIDECTKAQAELL